LDYLSFMLKVSGLIGFAFAVPQIYSYHLEFIFAPICHFYGMFFLILALLNYAYKIFFFYYLLNRNFRLLCHPLASSGECEPLKPENFQKGGKFEFCR
uniref:TLC domain-containing protein n=1 Tax=Dracunculus medinensis TaxID=318479 RepID=A0A0N4UKV1_DRAME